MCIGGSTIRQSIISSRKCIYYEMVHYRGEAGGGNVLPGYELLDSYVVFRLFAGGNTTALLHFRQSEQTTSLA